MLDNTDRINNKIFSVFSGTESGPTLPGLMLSLLTQQKKSWPQFSTAIEALERVRIRKLPGNGCSVKLQFNPARIISTGASIDQQSVKERPCFLCLTNLPEPQQGILYRRNFLILCNPYPIFNGHYTLSHVDHIPQSISASTDYFLKLAEDLSPVYNVFYNGPRAGASAPDHLHFQASPAGVLPVEKELHGNHNRRLIKSSNGKSLLFRMDIPGRQAILVESKSMDAVAGTLMSIVDRLTRAIPTSDEPIMNLLCSYRDNTWRLVIFLRRKHRPDVYYIQGEGRILISPGLVEMGGLVITPIEKDFITLDAEMMENIYKEISLDPEIFQQVVDSL